MARLTSESAALKSEVSALKGYMENSASRAMDVDARQPLAAAPGTMTSLQQWVLGLEAAKLKQVNSELQSEIERMRHR